MTIVIQIALCSKQYGTYFDSPFYKQLNEIGIQQCSKRCYSEKLCKSINFSKTKYICTLNYYDNQQSQLVQKSEFIYVDRNYMSKYFSAPIDCADNTVLLAMHDDKKFCFRAEYWCNSPALLDWENNPEVMVFASSSYTGLYVQGLDGPSSWCVASLASVTSEYIQFEFSKFYQIHGVVTQGRNSVQQWITLYRVQSSNDKVHWTQIGNDYVGNSNHFNKVTNNLTIPVTTRYLRIVLVTYVNFACARFDLIGCAVVSNI